MTKSNDKRDQVIQQLKELSGIKDFAHKLNPNWNAEDLIKIFLNPNPKLDARLRLGTYLMVVDVYSSTLGDKYIRDDFEIDLDKDQKNV